MSLEQIRQRTENGFKPFTLSLSDGRKFLVPHRDFVAVGRNVVVVIAPDDRVTTIDPLHIVSIEEPGERG